ARPVSTRGRGTGRTGIGIGIHRLSLERITDHATHSLFRIMNVTGSSRARDNEYSLLDSGKCDAPKAHWEIVVPARLLTSPKGPLDRGLLARHNDGIVAPVVRMSALLAQPKPSRVPLSAQHARQNDTAEPGPVESPTARARVRHARNPPAVAALPRRTALLTELAKAGLPFATPTPLGPVSSTPRSTSPALRTGTAGPPSAGRSTRPPTRELAPGPAPSRWSRSSRPCSTGRRQHARCLRRTGRPMDGRRRLRLSEAPRQ
ncbi:MAG: hypothetical protein QOI75_2530, partial [Pseudonocardiales bacterium]|nr:hypothetical protein [Pseudonocardiales bacterium]